MQTYEEPVAEPFMSAKKVDPIMQREQMAADLRKSKKKELLSKKRNQHGLFQEQEPGFPEHEYREEQMYLEQEYYELPQRGPGLTRKVTLNMRIPSLQQRWTPANF